jgi:hypothetical protein
MSSNNYWLSLKFFALKATSIMSAISNVADVRIISFYNATQDSSANPAAELNDIS